MTSKYTPEQKLERALVWLMREPQTVAMSGILMMGKHEIVDDKDCPTAYTDGLDCKYGRSFIEKLTEEEVRGVVLHEAKHVMYRHTTMWRPLWEMQPQLANISCDHVVNGSIMEMGHAEVKLPEGAIYDPKYSGLDAKQIFKSLEQELDAKRGGGPGAQGFDQHGWEEAQNWSEEEQRQLAEKVDSAIRQGAILAGKVAGNIPREIGELTEVRTDYREIMREFFTTNVKGLDESTWRRPNRRWIQHDVYLPSQITEAIDHVVCGVDTSGSIQGQVLTDFLSNVSTMLKQLNPEKFDLLYWDTEVAGHEEYTTDTLDALASSTKPAGGGGTSPSCVPRYMKKKDIKPTCVVMLTDGYVDSFPDFGIPTLWVVYDNPGCTPPTGLVAHIDGSDY